MALIRLVHSMRWKVGSDELTNCEREDMYAGYRGCPDIRRGGLPGALSGTRQRLAPKVCSGCGDQRIRCQGRRNDGQRAEGCRLGYRSSLNNDRIMVPEMGEQSIESSISRKPPSVKLRSSGCCACSDVRQDWGRTASAFG